MPPQAPPPKAAVVFNEDVNAVLLEDSGLLAQSYTMTPEIIGTGKFGNVLMGFCTNKPEMKVAIKTISKDA